MSKIKPLEVTCPWTPHKLRIYSNREKKEFQIELPEHASIHVQHTKSGEVSEVQVTVKTLPTQEEGLYLKLPDSKEVIKLTISVEDDG